MTDENVKVCEFCNSFLMFCKCKEQYVKQFRKKLDDTGFEYQEVLFDTNGKPHVTPLKMIYD